MPKTDFVNAVSRFEYTVNVWEQFDSQILIVASLGPKSPTQ